MKQLEEHEQTLVNLLVRISRSKGNFDDLITAALDTLKEVRADERESLRRDMLVRMKEWHGTGIAMVKDYFALSTPPDNDPTA